MNIENREKLAKELEKKANELRIRIIQMIYEAKSGHPGGSLSIADIIAVLYFHFMRIDPKNPSWEDRDRFILSKGHTCPVWYVALAMRGFFPLEKLSTLRQINGILQGHPDMRKVPGIDMTTGSLGQGLSIGDGMALMGKLDKKNYKVYVVLGDGELNEGQIWEAAMLANKYKLDNLIAIVDYNKLQLDGPTEVVMPLEPLADKWRAFGWYVIEIDGHNILEIIEGIEEAHRVKNKPIVIIAHTIKGKCVSYMENECDWHGKAPNKEQFEIAIKELGGIKLCK
ncbi:MAG: transketolase [Candidatus Firestonebacteria bacterium]